MFNASFWQTLPNTLQQPAAIAIFSSVIAHGIFFAVFPILTASQPSEANSQRIVSVVDLSPAERSRLPKTTTSQVLLPPIQIQKGDSVKLPQGSTLPSPDPFDAFKTPSFPSYILPPPTDPPIPVNTDPFPTRIERRIVRQNSPSNQTPLNNQTPPSNQTPPNNQFSPNNQTPPGNQTPPNNQLSPNNQTPPNNQLSPNNQTPPSNQNLSNNQNLRPPLESVKKEIAERQQYQYNATGTAYTDDGTWLNQIYSQLPEEQRGINSKNEPLQTSYEISYNLNPPPKRAIIKIVIDSKTQKVIGYQLDQKTGYAKLDEEALKLVQEDALKLIKEKIEKKEVKPYEIIIRGVDFIPKKTAQG